MKSSETVQSGLQVHSLKVRQDNWAYVVTEAPGRPALLVDCPEAGPIQQWLFDHEVELGAIFITHHHFDHIAGLDAFSTIPVFCSERDRLRLGQKTPPIAVNTESGRADLKAALDFQSELEIMEIPGHTEGQIGLRVIEEGPTARQHFFTGDTLFQLGCGRVFEGTPQLLFESLQRIKSLPEHCLLYVGHDYLQNNTHFALALRDRQDLTPETQRLLSELDWTLIAELQGRISSSTSFESWPLKQELAVNPFLRAHQFEVFRELRALKDRW